MNIKIRKAKLGDEKEIGSLMKQFWEEHKRVDPLLELSKSPTLNHSIQEAREDIISFEKKKGTFYFVAIVDNKIVGCKLFRIRMQHSFFKVRKYGFFDTIVVDKKYRRKGVAKTLDMEAVKILKKHGIKYIKTHVYLNQKGALKKSLNSGFKPVNYRLIKKI
ncbi:MAG: GNAT family N-acetyltransferase [Nanoarchaeota archaeon]|nr:GNAT family N-acetyltransferase [Nanoarchaeota archaeon]